MEDEFHRNLSIPDVHIPAMVNCTGIPGTNCTVSFILKPALDLDSQTDIGS